MISETLRSLIRDSGLTPYEVAKRANISPQLITRFLNGERGLTLATLGRIAPVLGIALVRELVVSPADEQTRSAQAVGAVPPDPSSGLGPIDDRQDSRSPDAPSPIRARRLSLLTLTGLGPRPWTLERPWTITRKPRQLARWTQGQRKRRSSDRRPLGNSDSWVEPGGSVSDTTSLAPQSGSFPALPEQPVSPAVTVTGLVGAFRRISRLFKSRQAP